MKKLFLFLLFIIPIFCKGQISNNNATKFQRAPRFTIVQPTAAVKLTFKLDTYTGDVYQLIDTAGKSRWKIMLRVPTSAKDTQYSETSNYALFVSTNDVKYAYLINQNSGATWNLVEEPKSKENYFVPMVDR